MLNNIPLFQQNIKIVSKCPLCNKTYKTDQAEIIQENDTSQLIFISCPNCKTNMIALLIETQIGTNTISLISDLESFEIQKFSKLHTIKDDEVIDFYKRLKNKQFLNNLLKNNK